ncbi:CDP-alcohol phosphatidyltransferase family protein [Belnapia rosea]|uniref:CDP-alcohol phosphatidyltransferase family protein n=1 Tax=Belnapia rosea TaxID=938405 RepID=UPI00088518F5|nr:CDP-alcohol phosphatidyltransferase family protein [Belnapia rosea]SDB60662.1 CDP-alcohol phosphatidyltransferase [Belnapia rosea]
MSANTVIHRIVRPAVRVIAPTGVTPNHVTTLRLVTGTAAAVAFAMGGVLWPAIGGGIFVLSMLLDRADGELARQTGQSSPGGYWYDIISDCASNVMAMIGIGIGLHDVLGVWGPVLGIVAGAGIGALFWQLFGLSLAQPRGWEFSPGLILDPDDALILVPIFVWTGTAVPMIIVAAVVTPLAALWLGLQGWRAKRA